jgi:predicted DNA-binding transcriptional regulator AlpA
VAQNQNIKLVRDTYITESQLSKLTQISVKTLRTWRWRGDGPAFYRLGRSVRYSISDVNEWLQNARRTSTSDLGGN